MVGGRFAPRKYRMYLVDELNHYKLFQRTSKFVLVESCRDLLPQIFYRASACLISFIRITEYQNKCANEYYLFDDKVKLIDNKILFVSTASISILNEITPLLSNMRIMQNQLITLIGKYYHKSVPASIADFNKKKDAYDLPDNIKDLITNYWKNHGEYLRNLRDIDQHFFEVIENSYLIVKPKTKIVILFPDNPESKSKKELSFNKQIDGLIYLQDAFNQINTVFEQFSKLLGFEPGDILFSVNLKHLFEKDKGKVGTRFMFYREHLRKINNKFGLSIKALFFNQKENDETEVFDTGLSPEKVQYLNTKK